MLPTLTMTLIAIDLRVTQSLTLNPWPVPALRGILGQNLRARCPTEGRCLEQACPYCALFETPQEPPVGPKRFYTPPRPFVIQTQQPGHHWRFEPGQTLPIRIKLFGQARRFTNEVVEALDHLHFQPGSARQRACGIIDPLGTRHPLDARSLRAPWYLDPTPLPDEPSQLRLTLTTPLSLRHQGALLQRFDAEIFTARAIDRLECLAYYYEGIAADWDVHGLRAQAREVRTIPRTEPIHYSRSSRRHAHRQAMEGIIGEVIAEGISEEVAALWRCAQETHVGRDTVFGHGALRLGAP